MPPQQEPHAESGSLRHPWVGVFHWVLTHRPSRLIVPPLILVALIGSLATPLLNDLRLLSEDNLVSVEQGTAAAPDGDLIVNVKSINPNTGVATLEMTYVTDDLDNGTVELWIASGGVTLKDDKLVYETDTELHRVPIVMDSPTVFVWGKTKRATYKRENTEIKIDQRTPGYFCPFDRYVIKLSFALTDKSQKTLHPKLWCELEDPHFVNAAPQPLMSHGEHAVAVPNSLLVVLDRPMYEKIFLGLSLLMGLGCVLWALYKITYTSITAMESLSLMGFDFTVLVAVPALRGVFVPSNLQFAPLFDFFVVLIWTMGLLTLIVNIFRHDVMVRTRGATSAEGHVDPVLFVAQSVERDVESKGTLPRRAAS